MAKIRLKFKLLSDVVGTEDVNLIILTDEAEERQLSIVCDKQLGREFLKRIDNAHGCSTMLPETLCTLLYTTTENLHLELLIEDIVEGQYRTMLYDANGGIQPRVMRTPDAVLLAYMTKMPLYIDAALFRRQSVRYVPANRFTYSMPINSVTDDMLEMALQRAVAAENYELAAALRDEMRVRKAQCELND